MLSNNTNCYIGVVSEAGFSSYITTSTSSFATGKSILPERVQFDGLVTIVFFEDDSKVVVRCNNFDEYDRETAVAYAIAQKVMGSKAQFKKFVKRKGFETKSLRDGIDEFEKSKKRKIAK